MKHMIIENKQLRKALDREGLNHFELAKDRDYFYVTSTKDATPMEEVVAIWANSIPVYAFNRQSIDQWVKDIKETLEESWKEHGSWLTRGKNPDLCTGGCDIHVGSLKEN